jgi:hypothetical protein
MGTYAMTLKFKTPEERAAHERAVHARNKRDYRQRQAMKLREAQEQSQELKSQNRVYQ